MRPLRLVMRTVRRRVHQRIAEGRRTDRAMVRRTDPAMVHRTRVGRHRRIASGLRRRSRRARPRLSHVARARGSRPTSRRLLRTRNSCRAATSDRLPVMKGPVRGRPRLDRQVLNRSRNRQPLPPSQRALGSLSSSRTRSRKMLLHSRLQLPTTKHPVPQSRSARHRWQECRRLRFPLRGAAACWRCERRVPRWFRFQSHPRLRRPRRCLRPRRC